MNNIYYGNNQYDIESAANYYFGATTNQNNSYPIITVLQSAMLASKVNAPSVYDINNVSNNFKNRIKVNLEKCDNRIIFLTVNIKKPYRNLIIINIVI